MKKSIIILLLLATFVAGYSQAGNLKKQTYIRLGMSLPGWKYIGHDGKSDWSGDFKRIGGIFETGSIFMLNSIKIAPNMRLGINVDYLSLNYHKFTSSSLNQTYHFFYFGSKIGPSFSYSPVSRLVFDAYFKFNPVWVAGNVSLFHSDLIDDSYYLGFLGLKYSAGLNIRYSILMVGIEINPGIANLRSWDTDQNKLSHNYMGNLKDNTDKTPIPGLNLTIGLSF